MRGLRTPFLFAVSLCTLLAAPARAQLSSHPHEEGQPQQQLTSDHRGLYAGIGADVGLQFLGSASAKFAYGAEARVGFSFNRALQIYLSGALLNASYDNGDGSSTSVSVIHITANLHHFLYVERSGLGVFYNAGIGVGLVTNIDAPLANDTGVGLAYNGGLGVEIPISPILSLSPEIFYRGINSASANGVSVGVNAVGLQIGIVYY
jgi:hypothetical protein